MFLTETWAEALHSGRAITPLLPRVEVLVIIVSPTMRWLQDMHSEYTNHPSWLVSSTRLTVGGSICVRGVCRFATVWPRTTFDLDERACLGNYASSSGWLLDRQPILSGAAHHPCQAIDDLEVGSRPDLRCG